MKIVHMCHVMMAPWLKRPLFWMQQGLHGGWCSMINHSTLDIRLHTELWLRYVYKLPPHPSCLCLLPHVTISTSGLLKASELQVSSYFCLNSCRLMAIHLTLTRCCSWIGEIHTCDQIRLLWKATQSSQPSYMQCHFLPIASS